MTWDPAGQALNEAQFRELARRGPAPEPSPAIFDARTGRAYRARRLGPQPRAQGRAGGDGGAEARRGPRAH